MATASARVVLGVLASLLVLALGSLGCSAQSGNYPTKAIELVVAFGPGGGTDTTARLVAPYLSKKWGQPINVVNEPAASTIAGTKKMMEAAPDGYTMLMDTNPSSSMQGATMLNLPFKGQDRTPVGVITIEPVAYYVSGDSPWKSLKDVAEHAKSKPGALKWATAGASGSTVFAMGLLFKEAGVNMADTNKALFDSGGAVVNAVAGGHADITATSLSSAVGLLDAKKLKIVAVTPERHSAFPSVSTVREQGYNFDIALWHGITGPPKLPASVVQKWADGLKEASKDPQFVEAARKQYKIVTYMGPDDFRKYLREEYEKYTPLAENMGIRK